MMSEFEQADTELQNEAAPSPESAETPTAESEETAASAPPTPPKKKESMVGILLEYTEILIFSVCAVLLIFTLFFRLCMVNGNSMNRTLTNGEMLITTTLTEPEQGDIIVFHMTSKQYPRFNEPLVKRVIATEGQTVRIDYATGEVSVDGTVLDEPYISLLNRAGYEVDGWTQVPAHNFDYDTGVFEATVPEGCLFVMGDNRNNSADSRTNEVSFVDARRVLGKVICRISPFTTYD